MDLSNTMSRKQGVGRFLPLGGILLLAALLRFFRLGRQSYWADEVTSIWEVDGLHGPILENLMHSIHGPLHFALLGIWGRIGGFGEVWTRSLSVLTGLLGVWLIYILARRLANERVALWTALFMAVSPFHIWYSQEVRNYAQLITLSILSMILLLRILDRGSLGNWLAFFLVAIAAMLSNLAAAFLFAAQGIYLLLRRPRLAARILLILVVIVVLLLPWIRNFDIGWRPDLVNKAGAVRNTNFHPLFLPYTISVYGVGDTVGPTRDEMNRGLSADMFIPWLPYFAIAGAAFALLFLLGLRARRGLPEGIWFFLLWLLVPIIITAALAVLNVKAYNVRYVSVGFPAFLILIAAGLESMRGRWRRMLLLVAMLCIFVSLKNFYFDSYYWKPDARTAAATLAEHAIDGDLLLIYSIEEPFRYYYEGAGELRGLNWANPGHDVFWEYMTDFESNFERVWLVDYRAWYADPEGLTKDAFAERWDEAETLEFLGIEARLYLNRNLNLESGSGQ
jgi:mannosyltransferase